MIMLVVGASLWLTVMGGMLYSIMTTDYEALAWEESDRGRD